jgi:hypothetical protein
VPFRRGVAAVVVLGVAAAVVGVVVLVGGGDEGSSPAPRAGSAPRLALTPAPRPALTPVPTPALDAVGRGASLAVGITEPNPSLVASPFARSVPPEFSRWRDALSAIHPAVYRLVVPWASVQPRPAAAPNLALLNGGCSRTIPPCAPFAGLRDQLRALASRQKLEPGWAGMLVVTTMPPWAGRSVRGCRRGSSPPTAAPPRPIALRAYRSLLRYVLSVARTEGASIRYVSPWNEPNHPYFLAPQRAACDPASPTLAAAPYAALARAARAELSGDQELLLGETAGILSPTARATSVGEFIRALPRSLVCSARVWSQHAYIGGTDPVAAVSAALDARGCARRHAIWITETGVGPAPGGLSLARGITSEDQGCRLLHRRLVAWYENPRVTVAVQYTFREDEAFPTGLVTADLRRARPALREWQAWGDRRPDAHPPRSTCAR